MKWKILEINGENGTASNVRYKVTHEGVESEGYWHFEEPKSLDGVDEWAVIQWVREATMKDGQNAVESRIKEQVEALKIKQIDLPWRPKTFTVTV